MQTNLADFIKDTPEGQEADAILRKCVHCGFCLATCPTYNVLNNELDSPRGRIYLIKQMLEGQPVTSHTRDHLDRCLQCRACETTCPSNVEYHRLLDIAIPLVEQQAPRNVKQRLLRTAIVNVLPYRSRFQSLLRLGQTLKPLLPSHLKVKIPAYEKKSPWPSDSHPRKMLVLEGCVQPALAPDINAASARILSLLGISLIAAPKAGCCGAVSYHLNQQEDGLDFMRRNIDAWWPYIEAGCEAIVITASGCGATIKEYGELLKCDATYADKAFRVSSLAKDIVEILSHEELHKLSLNPDAAIAFQCPCSLQHAQGLSGEVEKILTRLGFKTTFVADNHLCCGSAGTYSIFQPELATELKNKKLSSLMRGAPDVIGTANIGCMTHLASAEVPVKHWIQIVDQSIRDAK
ncbi:glycolate oxidase iron-sulfur subunit [Amphritea opalescens]|uniref:Glycolate oxidase iron-sulfur subunit n=1 Tax=Amphritea opalescens TaxID=2490544 RepID=A0A430KN31_9GAMM|nr:glycolate oxidase subunit GlcF [Amphritea opalescens]RTE64901.1 glycolate oxidase iron-sulfur subunit [Amphritea opalescens]